MANLELPEEIPIILKQNCDGIGLYRTEYLYMNRTDLPTEEEQFKAYRYVAEAMAPNPVIIRTLDLGGDKFASSVDVPKEMQSFLGWRAIRFCLGRPDIFKAQLRAILRASVYGNLKMMYPMVSGVSEFLEADAIFQEVKNSLKAEKIHFKNNMPVGVMIEVPSAAVTSDLLASETGFFSIGTNRNNQQVASYYIQHHPAVILLLKQIIKAADSNNIPVAVCGEMASLSMYIPLLIGLGVRELSLNPAQAAEVKAVIRKCDGRLFDLVNSFDFNTSIQAVETFLTQTLKDYYTI